MRTSRRLSRHADYVLDWDIPPFQLTYRAVFVGFKHPLQNPDLLEEIPEHQQRVP